VSERYAGRQTDGQQNEHGTRGLLRRIHMAHSIDGENWGAYGFFSHDLPVELGLRFL
jgi:hypothetical protein